VSGFSRTTIDSRQSTIDNQQSTMNSLFRLDDRVAVVTGASGKLGPVWINALAGAGARVAGLDLESSLGRPEIARLREELGGRFRAYAADVTSRASLERACAQCAADLGPPAVLVNNAGIDSPPVAAASRYRMEDVPFEVSRTIFEVNTLGAFQSAQVFGREMLKAGRGSIVNIGSLYASVSPDLRFYDHLGGDPPFLKPPAYGASKAALLNLTKYLATAWAPRGVRVNALSPGGVEGGQDAEFKRKFCARVPLGRMASLDDLAGPLLFLASDASSYVTGIELRVDGGFTVW
jgi:NAD(P)-dependent dehydrogenase (short-subunit alcohol dehydrogenase family)